MHWHASIHRLCCDRKSRAACVQSFALWQQATIEFTCHDHSIIACSRHIDVLLFFAHIPLWWITHLKQCQWRDCYNIPPFCNEPHNVLWRLYTARLPHPGHSTILLRSEKPERHVRKASHCGSKQQRSSHAMITIVACSRHRHTWSLHTSRFMVNHTFNTTPTERLQQG